MFQLLPKCHHLWHLAHDTYQSRLNPKLSQLMSAESFIGGDRQNRSGMSQIHCAVSRNPTIFSEGEGGGGKIDSLT